MNSYKHVHFIGIGGIGMSAVARLALEQGIYVSGSTLGGDPALLKQLAQLGAHITLNHSAALITQTIDCVVYSSGIPEDNEELREARDQGKKILHRAQLLNELLKGYKVIAVSGTHGKTTTTSLIGHILEVAGMDPLVVVGGVMPAYKSNVRFGKGEWAVVEADESDGSFLAFSPLHISVVTNVEPEHMTFYKSIDNLHQHFVRFLNHTSQKRFVCAQDPFLAAFLNQDSSGLTIGYGNGGDVQVRHIKATGEGIVFEGVYRDHVWPHLFLSLKGEHNMLNALAAFGVALEVGVKPEAIYQGLKTFRTVDRRLTVTGNGAGLCVVDDYAHHPTEIKAVIQALKRHHEGRVVAICQPHRYSRLGELMDDFSQSFQQADSVVLLPVYSAGEDPIPGVNSEVLYEKTCRHHQSVFSVSRWQEHLISLCDLIKQVTRPGDFVLCCGAGDVTQLAYLLPSALEQETIVSYA